MSDEEDGYAPPWFAPGHGNALSSSVCTPRPRERLWTLVKGGKRVDAELLFHNEHGVEVQFAHDGVMAYGQRFPLKADAVAEAEQHRTRLHRAGWTIPMTEPSID